ncbi:MAG TPA: heterodisulfide reductase-related iron-sulfur binding cluster [Geopsychrobacteraceae bacterium]|nr:heterodisulfide reductase-related iron-sulfur binding cluster [Geopsychrobacteraceae bacterium]
MEYTREIYWNVGDGATTLIPMYLFTLLAVVVLVKGAHRRILAYRQGTSLNRTDQLFLRIRLLLKNVILQSRVLNVRWAGLGHSLFFWGFFLLFIGTCLIFLQADFTDLFFGIKFLTGNFYLLFSIILDLSGLIAIISLLGLFIRRYIVQPSGLDSKADDILMHGLLLTILISGFLIEGARMAATEMGTPLAAWSPVGLLVANSFTAMPEQSLRTLHTITWWVHFALVAGFIASIPFTKFRHIFTTSANYLFSDLGPTGKLTSLDLEDENAESFGAARVQDLTWKDIFDGDACTLCKRCQDRCPAHTTDKPLSPMTIVKQIGKVAQHNPESNLIEACDKEAIWACTTCFACQSICPANIEHVGKIIDMRRNLVLMEGEFPGDEVMAAMEHTEVNGNPLGSGYATRADWTEGLGVKTLAEDSEVDILYFAGCYASFDARNIKIAKAFIKLCQAAGVKVGILGKEEKCCGEPMRKMGNEYLYQTLATTNIAQIKSYGINKIVTSCPHCLNTLNKDYRDFDFDVEVESYTTFLNQLVKNGQLKIKSESFDCTYHDSCYLGRHNGVYDAPRELLHAAGGTITEMEKNRSEAFCCSAGGGRIMAEENLGRRINVERVRMAEQTRAPSLISNCPFCLTMFEDGIKGAELEGSLRSMDISEILLQRLEESKC